MGKLLPRRRAVAQLAGERHIAIQENEKVLPISSLCAVGLFGPKAHSGRNAGSVSLDYSAARRDPSEAFLELYFFEQKIGNQAAETRVLDH